MSRLFNVQIAIERGIFLWHFKLTLYNSQLQYIKIVIYKYFGLEKSYS